MRGEGGDGGTGPDGQRTGSRTGVLDNWSDEASVIMNTPEHEPTGRSGEPTLGDERSCLELMLKLQPFPCLVVETETGPGGALQRGGAADALRRPRGDRADACYATDAEGGRIEPEQVIPYLVGRDAGGDGMELTWHAPGRAGGSSGSPAPLPRKDGNDRPVLLTFLDVTGQKAAEDELREPSRPATSSSRSPPTS